MGGMRGIITVDLGFLFDGISPKKTKRRRRKKEKRSRNKSQSKSRIGKKTQSHVSSTKS